MYIPLRTPYTPYYQAYLFFRLIYYGVLLCIHRHTSQSNTEYGVYGVYDPTMESALVWTDPEKSISLHLIQKKAIYQVISQYQG